MSRITVLCRMSSDFAIYGLCPARDEFYLVVCEICGALVKPQALQQHTGIITAVIVNKQVWQMHCVHF